MKLFLCICTLLVLLTGCSAEPASQQFFAMDTVMSITAYGKDAEEGISASITEINRLESLLSRTRPDSDVSRLNDSAPAPVSVSPDTVFLLQQSRLWNEKTGGAFDITLGPVIAAWGFAGGDGTYQVPSKSQLTELLTLAGPSALPAIQDGYAALAQPGMAVDLGGIAKGYAGTQVSLILQQHNISSALLSLGGNITAVGTKPDGSLWRVGIQDPVNPSALVGSLQLQNCSAVTSGAYQRFFEQDGTTYHHIINPHTGCPASSGLTSVTVVSPDSTLADLLSTACFVLGEQQALDLQRTEGGFELLLITQDDRLVITPGLEDIFTASPQNPYRVEIAS